jgi:dinuclear metal center YbgI/SA1388 family protein
LERNQLSDYLHTYLESDTFTDLAPNGLQVEGKEEVNKLVTGVSASVALFDRAIIARADAVLVHHGIIWSFEQPVFQGGYRERLRMLLENNINLYAYHLPLDAHREIGNNVQICMKLGLKNIEPFGEYKGQLIGMRGNTARTHSKILFKKIEDLINNRLLIYPYGPDEIETVAVMSGGGQKDVRQAVTAGIDLFITGEVSEYIMHYAKEEGIHFVSAGHYATEKFGVKALGEHLHEKFNIDVQFIDIPNPA